MDTTSFMNEFDATQKILLGLVKAKYSTCLQIMLINSSIFTTAAIWVADKSQGYSWDTVKLLVRIFSEIEWMVEKLGMLDFVSFEDQDDYRIPWLH